MHLTHITLNHLDHDRRLKNQAHSAVSAKYQVLIIALGRAGELKEENALFGDVRRIFSPFVHGGPLKFIHYNLHLFFLLWHIRTDILHAHDLWVLPAAALIAAFKKRKLVYDAHEYYAGLMIFKKRPVRKLVWLFMESLLVKYIDALLTVSEPLAEKYRQRYPNISDYRVIRNLPFREQPSLKQAMSFPRPFKHMLVYHGHLKPGRGLENLIRAMAHVENTGLVIIGGGELLERIRRLVCELDVSEKVIINDYVSLESIISTSAQADIGVVLFEKTSTNYSYALPNKFFEYIMAGLPVLTSDIETLSGYVQKYDLGRTVDPSDPRLIGKTILEMTGDPEALQKWRKNAHKASEDLNWDREAEKLLKIYEKLAD